jgi:hypothetical protein
MTERRRQSHVFGKRTAHSETLPPDRLDELADPASPGIPQPRLDDEDDITILGFPAVAGLDDVADPPAVDPWAEPTVRLEEGLVDAPVHLVILERADPVAGVALVLAGVAAGASLWLPWSRNDAETGLSLVRRGLAVAGTGVDALGRSGGQWEPTAIVLGGVLLLLLGVLLFLPSRTHRVVGLLALCLAIAVTAGVLSRIAQAGWSSAGFERGMWCAVAVAGLGILGALKAMLTVPRVALRVRRTVPQ